MATFQQRKNQLYYGPGFKWPVFTGNNMIEGELSSTFKARFKKGEVGELPPGWMFNTVTSRFFLATRANRKKQGKNMDSYNGVLFPASILDYNVETAKNNAMILKYQAKRQQETDSNAQRRRLVSRDVQAIDGNVITKTYANVFDTQGDAALKYFLRFIPDIKEIFRRKGSLKVMLTAVARFENHGSPIDLGFSMPAFQVTTANTTDIKQGIDGVISNLKNQLDNLDRDQHYQKFVKILTFEMKVLKFTPTRGSSYIATPKFLASKGALINIKNEDNMCFKYSVLCGLHHQEIERDHQRVTKYAQWADELKFTGITFPVKAEVNTMRKFEELNNLSVNVFIFNESTKAVNPLITSQKQVPEGRAVDLLLISNKTTTHYVCVKSLSRLLSTQYNASDDAKHFCRYCLHGFSSAELLQKHKDIGCAIFGEQKTVMPTEGKDDFVQFKNIMNKYKAPFAIYADFESILEPIEGPTNSPAESWTQMTHKHVPCGFCIYGVSNYDDIQFKPILYRGKDTITQFYSELGKLENKMIDALQRKKQIQDMSITPKQQAEVRTATHCHICEKKFQENEVRVRDHDHISGNFRGIAHYDCNINLNWKNWKIPVFFHNLKNYDSHFIISEVNKQSTGKVSVIANSSEKFVTFSYHRLKFLDSCAFLSASLDSLVNNLKKGKSEAEIAQTFKHTRKVFGNDNQFKLVTQKGVYPYEHMVNFARFDETQLPAIEQFYSELCEEGIDDNEYKLAQTVWNEFGMRNMGDYHDLYLKTDVLLLADVFESFRNVSIDAYGLDPTHYVTLPSYAWDCMLKKTGIRLKLFTDPDMYIFTERSKRGGVSMIAHRYAKANNPNLSDYDKEKVKSFITYLDANNLYGWAMSEALPFDGFEWVESESFSLSTMCSDSETGYFVEVDLEYPEELHDLHSDLPVAPENIIVQDGQLSNWQTAHKEKLDIGKSTVPKLIPNLNTKKNYVVHSRNLQCYIDLGLKVMKVHRVLKFKQKPWLKEYIDLNTSKRAQAKNDFEKDFYKLMNNAVFGKTMENLRGRCEFELVNCEKRFAKVAANPRLSGVSIIRPQSEEDIGLVGMKLTKNEVMLNKPIYAGCAILDLSKVLMYDFHYGFIKEKYGSKAKLLFTDTDSLCYHIETEDLHKDFKANESLFDFSDMPKEHPLHSNANKKVIGKFKPEELSETIQEFVGIRAKMYSLLMTGKKPEKKTAKGIKRCAMKRISHEDYKRCLFGEKEEDMRQMVSFSTFRSIKQQVYTVKVNKVGLCVYDDKRYIIDGVSSLPYGHKDI